MKMTTKQIYEAYGQNRGVAVVLLTRIMHTKDADKYIVAKRVRAWIGKLGEDCLVPFDYLADPFWLVDKIIEKFYKIHPNEYLEDYKIFRVKRDEPFWIDNIMFTKKAGNGKIY